MDKIGEKSFNECTNLERFLWLRKEVNELIRGHEEIIEKLDKHISFEEMINEVCKRMNEYIGEHNNG